jgi:hypothetical protein
MAEHLALALALTLTLGLTALPLPCLAHEDRNSITRDES